MFTGLGCSCQNQLQGPDDEPLVAWPWNIETLKNQTNTEIERIARDVNNSQVLTSGEKQSFTDFYNEWQAYLDEFGFFDKMSGATWDELQRYRERAAQWDAAMRERGGHVSGPKPRLQTDPRDYLQWGVVIGGVALGAWLFGPSIKRWLERKF